VVMEQMHYIILVTLYLVKLPDLCFREVGEQESELKLHVCIVRKAVV